jgi:hypothetical protein
MIRLGIVDWLRRKLCPQLNQQQNIASFTDEEVRRILDTRSRLRHWLGLAQAGVVGATPSGDVKGAIMEVIDLANRLYEWYVPPFNVNRVALSEQELQSVISDLRSRGGLQGWLRLDKTYYATDLDTFRRIVEWDWTDTRKYLVDRFDCDEFAMYFKARVSIDFGINAIGVVVDYSAGHAYNIVIIKDRQGVRWYLYEPQTDAIFTYEQRNQRFYTMQHYYLLL